MTDFIRVKRIVVHAFHGVMPEEAKLGQRFLMSLEVETDLSRAGRSDDLAHTISYARLIEIAVEIATQQRFHLIEALAETIAAAILAEFPTASATTILIEKPSAPIAALFDTASVEIRRVRSAS